MPKLATLAVLGIAGLPAMGAAPVRAESTLATVKARGQLLCGINGQLPGFLLMRNTTASLERTAHTPACATRR